MLARIARLFLLTFIVALVLFPCQASAVGIGTTPSKLDFSVRAGNSVTKILHVVNTGNSETHYKVYVDEQYEDWFDINPQEFSLAPQANKQTQITISPPLFSSGDYATHVYVVVANSHLQLGVGAGIKVPVHVHISNLLLWVGMCIAAALLVALTLFLIRRRRTPESETK